MALIDRIHEINRQMPNRQYYRLYVNNVGVGFVDTQLLDDLADGIFKISPTQRRVDIAFEAHQRQDVEASITHFFKACFSNNQLNVWRDEIYAVSDEFGREPLFLIERSVLSFLGISGYGVHINGYIERDDGIHMWVAKRSLNKQTSPGKLDQIAAGGQPYGLSIWDNMLKECEEEASIPAALATKARSVSVISYFYDLDIGARPDVIFNYDLRLPNDFEPSVNDGEVDSFTLYPIRELLELIENTHEFKFNSAVVVIDFAIRHGLIKLDHPDYLALQEGMNQRYQRMQSVN